MEHALGALHNLALMDAKAKSRALEAGVLVPLVSRVGQVMLGHDSVSASC
jgi:hypothetical protein